MTLLHTPADVRKFQASAGQAADLMKALSNETRLMILCRLGAGELAVSALQDLVGLSQSALSQHLARLREDGLVAARREGTAMVYRIANPDALRVIDVLADIFCPPPR